MLVIILSIVIYSNRDDISEMISINSKDLYDSNNSSTNICKKKTNANILGIYEYNDTVSSGTDGYCVVGTEDTCKELNYPATNNGIFVNDYKAGTIVKYQVNDNDIYYFNVLHDDGDTMTLQSVDAITQSAWNESGDGTQGPITALTAITEATKNWDNVNDLTYSLGETIFLKYPNNSNNANPYTNCNGYNNCTNNSYVLSSELTTNVKARLLSLQEAYDLGCTNDKTPCPNYLSFVGGYQGLMNTYLYKTTYIPWYLSGNVINASSSVYFTATFYYRVVVEITK
jgi:hypothetical protein